MVQTKKSLSTSRSTGGRLSLLYFTEPVKSAFSIDICNATEYLALSKDEIKERADLRVKALSIYH